MRIYTSSTLAYVLAFAGIVVPEIASAATINFTFKGATAEVSLNGAAPARVDLMIDVLADTNDLVKGGGWWGSDRYVNLKGFVSSKALGLSNVEVTTPLEVHIGGPAADPIFRDSTVMLSTGNNVLTGVFNMKAIEGWDRVTSIGPLSGPASTSVPVRLLLKNGSTLSIVTFESAQPYGNATFQAHVIPGVAIANIR